MSFEVRVLGVRAGFRVYRGHMRTQGGRGLCGSNTFKQGSGFYWHQPG